MIELSKYIDIGFMSCLKKLILKVTLQAYQS